MANAKPAPIYLDYQATTPTDPRVVDAMLPWFAQHFGNPHSSEHAHGWTAAEAVDRARAEVAALIGAKAKEIVFTSGATESNNLAIKGAAHHRRQAEGRTRVVTVATEHKCVLESCARLGREGFDVVVLGVDREGRLDLSHLEAAVDGDTALVTVMAANNEIGVLHPLAEIAEIAHRAGAWLHTDAAQAVGKVPVDVAEQDIDLLSISGHKIYGPKGIGALYVRRRPRISLEPQMDGGGQEKGVRSGTLAPALCVGLGKACALAAAEFEAEAERLAVLRDRFLDRVRTAAPDLEVNGPARDRLAGNLSITVPGVDSDELMAALDGVSVSSGSACSSGARDSSHVLRAIGRDPAAREATLRIGFGRFTTEEEVDAAAGVVVAACGRLRGAARRAAV